MFDKVFPIFLKMDTFFRFLTGCLNSDVGSGKAGLFCRAIMTCLKGS